MWIDLLPTLAMLAVVGWFIRLHRGRPILQIHALIVASYLNVFPALDFLLSEGRSMDGFTHYQLLIIGFFQLPLLFVVHLTVSGSRRVERDACPVPMRLSLLLLVSLSALLLAFWFVALHYDLFFRRLGFEGLLENTVEVPILLLYLYRSAVETAFLVIMFLWMTLRYAAHESRYYRGYQVVLVAYLATFVLFFVANSRMQFVLLLLCLICTQPLIGDFFLKRGRILRFGILLVVLVVGLTLFRELYFEDNGRIAVDDLPDLLLSVSRLIAGRLDSVVILYQLNDAGFDPWGLDLSGVSHVVNFYISFFTDPAAYTAIKESLVTSPSVEIVNRLLSVSAVDFPKSMILDMFLSFGVLGLLVTAALLGGLVGWVQRQLASFHRFTPAFLISLYALPMLLEFEKEFIGLFFAFLKWTPMLLLLFLARPRFGVRRHVGMGAAKPVTMLRGAAGTE